MGYLARYSGRDRGEMHVRRLCSETFLTSGLVAGTPVISGGPTAPFFFLGTTAGSSGPGFNIPFTMHFKLSQMQNYTEISTVFDQARINWVKVTITYQHNVSTASGSSTMPTLFWGPDYDDSIPVGAGALRERMSLQMCEFTSTERTHVMRITPRPTVYALDSTAGAPSASIVSSDRWISAVGGLNVNHFGVKGYLANVALPAEAPGAPVTTSFRIDVQMDVTFRGFR